MNGKKINSKIIIFILIFVIWVVCCVWVAITDSNTKNTSSNTKNIASNTKNTSSNTNDTSNIQKISAYLSTYLATKQLLEDKGFKFETQNVDNINFTWFSNNIITITAYIEPDNYKYFIEYWDKNVGSKTCGITDTSINTTETRKEQFDSYVNWKKEMGLNDDQIKEVLIKYYLESNNNDK